MTTTVNEAFPSRWLGVEDLQGHDRTVTIRRYVRENVAGEPKHVLYFDGEKKGWIINRTIALSIRDLYGETNGMEGWAGKAITLFRAEVKAYGKMWPVMRVRPVRPAVPTVNGQAARPAEPLVPDYDPDEVSDLADEDEGVAPAHDMLTGEIAPSTKPANPAEVETRWMHQNQEAEALGIAGWTVVMPKGQGHKLAWWQEEIEIRAAKLTIEYERQRAGDKQPA